VTAPASPARRLRRYAAGTALVVFPLVLIAQEFTNPLDAGNGADFFAVAGGESRGALVTSMLLMMLAGALMAPAVSGVLHQARDRGAALANAGAVFLVLGGLALFAEGVVWLTATALPGGDPAEMAAYFDRLTESSLAGGVWMSLMLCLGIGLAVLPWAAWRAGAVHWWVPALATAAVAVEFGLPFHSTASEVVVFAVLAAAYGTIGVRVLRMTDSEWDGVAATSPSPEPAHA
jgi:hypothetical protein